MTNYIEVRNLSMAGDAGDSASKFATVHVALHEGVNPCEALGGESEVFDMGGSERLSHGRCVR